jgi:hypothetical protein
MFVMESSVACVALPSLALLRDGTVDLFALHDAVCTAQRACITRGGEMAAVWVDTKGALLVLVFSGPIGARGLLGPCGP